MLAAILLTLAGLAQPDPPSPDFHRAADGGAFRYTPPRIDAGDYPPSALANDEQGTVILRADILPDGTISGCRVDRSSGSGALDAASCPLFVARAHFRVIGRTTPVTVRLPISWRLGDVRPAADGEPQP